MLRYPRMRVHHLSYDILLRPLRLLKLYGLAKYALSIFRPVAQGAFPAQILRIIRPLPEMLSSTL